MNQSGKDSNAKSNKSEQQQNLNFPNDRSLEILLKIFENGCLTAEKTALHNRNRPCFRNIENLCIRTRNEIIKSCTTVSNIHSQGMPWAIKDFIYAFIRLINCWHILNGYITIPSDGKLLGCIDKELTRTFRNSYTKWEELTINLSRYLIRTFYNLDENVHNVTKTKQQTNSNQTISTTATITPSTAISTTTMTATSTIAPQSSFTATKSITTTMFQLKPIVPTATNEYIQKSTKTIEETINKNPNIENCSNRTDNCTKTEQDDSDLDSTDEKNRIVYMKPGGYYETRKQSNDDEKNLLTIEFLSTARNITKTLKVANKKYLSKLQKTSPENELTEEVKPEADTYNKVQEWLEKNSFTDFPEMPPLHYTILLEQYRNTLGVLTPTSQPVNSCDIYELQQDRGGLRNNAKIILIGLLDELKSMDLAEIITEHSLECSNPEIISEKLKCNSYNFVNEVVRDLRHMINYLQEFICIKEKLKEFSLKFERSLMLNFPNCDFSHIIGKSDENVGKLQLKNCVIDDGGGGGEEFV